MSQRILLIATAGVFVAVAGCKPAPKHAYTTDLSCGDPIDACGTQAAVVANPNVVDVSLPEAVRASDVTGMYYLGDGKGLNLFLSIEDGGSFGCIWRGCTGVHGSYSGVWSLVDRHMLLNFTVDTDDMSSRFSRLDVLRSGGEVILVPSRASARVLKYGPSRYSCFSREPRAVRRTDHRFGG